MDLITAKELNGRLRHEKIVSVCGMSFRIRRIPLLLIGDENEDFWSLARQGRDALSRRINDLIANPKLPQFRRILLHGILAPKITALEGAEDAVAVDTLLADYPLAVGLYVEIIHLTLDAIPKAED